MKNWKGRSNIFISTWPKTGKDAENLPVSDDIIRVMKARLLADKVVRGNEMISIMLLMSTATHYNILFYAFNF